MALKQNNGREDELNALLDIPGVDPNKIKAQINPEDGTSDDDKTKIPDDKTKTQDDKPITIKDKSNIQDDDKTKIQDDKTTPPEDKTKNVPDPETIRTAMLNEMFGEQFKTVEDFKKANIPEQLKELGTLRQENQDLKTRLDKKPKHDFASDDIAKFNEFARETGIPSFEVFRKLNNSDVANMDDMDALIWLRISEDPDLVADIPRVRKNFERKFNVDKSKIESGDLTQEEYEDNLFDLQTEARKAKTRLIELKGKIKMPEPAEEKPPEASAGPEKWTPETEKIQRGVWGKIGKIIVDNSSKVPIPMRDAKDPEKKVKEFVNFVLPGETSNSIMQKAIDYAINNQLEISETDILGNESKIASVINYFRDRSIVDNLDRITHAIFERAKGMNQEEILKIYHNPSEIKRETPATEEEKLSFDEKRDKAFQLDMDR